MSERKELRDRIADILERGENDRSVALWHSDIERMTDMLLYLYTEFAKPMTYGKGNLIELSHNDDGKTLSSIEKTNTGYVVRMDGSIVGLHKIDSVETLRSIQKELLHKESIDWDYYQDMAGSGWW